MMSIKHIRSLALGLALLAFSAAGLAWAQESKDEYQDQWLRAQSALVAFANAQLGQGRRQLDRTALLVTYRRESERFASALARLSEKLPPPESALMHWKLLPLHERVLSAMKLVQNAEERDDSAALSAAWASFRDAVGALKRTLKEGEQ